MSSNLKRNFNFMPIYILYLEVSYAYSNLCLATVLTISMIKFLIVQEKVFEHRTKALEIIHC